jgi:hypothetical protein
MGATFAAVPGAQARQPGQDPTPPAPGGYPPRTPSDESTADSSAADIVSIATPKDLAIAMGIPAAQVVSASLNGSAVNAVGIGKTPLGTFFPTQGTTYAILSTGLAKSADDPNTSGGLSKVLGGLNNSQGNDMTQLRLTLHVPSTAKCASFDFQYLSEEFPEFVGSGFNDTFTAEKGGSTQHIVGSSVVAPLNFAFDSKGKIISVNTVYGVTGSTGTTYDGATDLLRAQTPVTGGANTLFVFTVQDLGDSIYDSAVFMDHWTWSTATCSKGTKELSLSAASIAAQDGHVLESTETSGVGGSNNSSLSYFYVGDDTANRQYRGILSFKTAGLPDNAVITKVVLRLTRYSVAGSGNPFAIFQGMYIDMRKGFFGSAAGLQNGDFEAAASKTGLGTFNPTPVGALYTFQLPATAFPYINKLASNGGVTQLRLRFKLDDNNDSTMNDTLFYSGSALTENVPVLTILYHLP